jgi:tetratricopeptide (TPR) repeat protein
MLTATSTATSIPLSGPLRDPMQLEISPLAPAVPGEIAAARRSRPQQLKRILAGDLDQIVLMALRSEPERRYSSAEQFADDLRCYLKGLPVRAHRDSPAYRAGKFVRRHAIMLGVGLFLILALVGSIVGTTTGLMMARRERGRTEDSFHNAHQAINRIFTRVSEEKLLKQPGLQPLRNELLKDAGRYYEDFFNQRDGDHTLRAELAAARARAAKVISLTSSASEAVPQYRQAVALWQILVTQQPANQNHRASLAQTLNDLGVALLPLAGRLAEALCTFRRAENLVEQLIAADPKSFPLRYELCLILLNIAEIQLRQGQPDDSLKTLHDVLAIASQLATEDPTSLDPRISLATAHTTVGRLLAAQPGELINAIAAYDQAIELLEDINREHPELADQAHRLAVVLSELSSLQQRAGQPELALQTLRRSLDIFERLDQWYPGLVTYQGGLGETYNSMGDLERQRGEIAQALTYAQKARPLFERLVSEHPNDIDFRLHLAKSHNNIGRLLKQVGKPAQALSSFQHAIDLYESLLELDPRNSYNLACNVALCIPLIGSNEGPPGSGGASRELNKGDLLRRQLYGDRAIEALRRAARGGFLDPETFQADTDLDPLRARADFKALVKETEEKPATARK